MQFQHGTFTQAANGSLTLTPYGVDGRQLLSDPCNYQNSVYTRYNQTEFFEVHHPYDGQSASFKVPSMPSTNIFRLNSAIQSILTLITTSHD